MEIPGACEYVTSCGKRRVAGELKSRILKWEIIPIYLGGSNVVTKVLTRGR